MNKPSDSQVLKNREKQRWSFIRKAQVTGFILAALITSGIGILCDATRPRFASFLGYMGEMVITPATLLVKIAGLSPHWFVNDRTGNLALLPFCLMIITNAILGLVCGTIVGTLFHYTRKNK